MKYSLLQERAGGGLSVFKKDPVNTQIRQIRSEN